MEVESKKMKREAAASEKEMILAKSEDSKQKNKSTNVPRRYTTFMYCLHPNPMDCGHQLYTFLETTLVTLSLLPHFIAFFNDEEIPGTPRSLVSTFLAFVLTWHSP
ncbi:hypothetical protein AAC387_Pa09g0687 [Persea americana]